MWAFGKEDALGSASWTKRLAVAAKVPIKANAIREDAVVSVDDDFASTAELIARAKAVRIVPDDWPNYADPAFVTIERARSDTHLKSLVHVDDEWRLGA
jgi:hypothetical protein